MSQGNRAVGRHENGPSLFTGKSPQLAAGNDVPSQYRFALAPKSQRTGSSDLFDQGQGAGRCDEFESAEIARGAPARVALDRLPKVK